MKPPQDSTTPDAPENPQTAVGGRPAPPCCASSPEPLHVYDWLDMPSKDDGERVAKEWLEQFVKPAMEKDNEWLNKRRLTCDYEGERYRCIGASRMGDVWITSDMKAENGYEKRVNVESLSNWLMVPVVKRKRGFGAMGLMAMTSLLAASCGFGIGGGRSAYSERNDPDRPKTPEDLKRMEAAQRKRDRKAARRNSQHNVPENPTR